jgi:methyltransferase (TIGR00027 family)
MESNSTEIAHVSDTALMTAACRALETVRADGLVRDPFAEQLAGARGMAIAHGLARLEMMCFGVAIRSRFLDELVMDTVGAAGIATVLSLGAGLDSRPWRLELPPHLRWIEVDFPAMLQYKETILAGVPPKCRLERIAADVNDASGRQSVFAAAGEGPTLMITEGLLMYLPAETVEALAAITTVRRWLLDASSPEMAERVGMNSYQAVENVRAASCLDGRQTLDVIQRHGWLGIKRRSYINDVWAIAAERIQSLFANRPEDMPAPMPADDPSGVHLFGRES